MPIVDFKCRSCGCQFDDLVKNTADVKGVICPKCGSNNPERLFTFEGTTNAGTQECTHHCATCPGCKH